MAIDPAMHPLVPAASFSLEGQAAVVTGGSQGIGWGLVSGLASAGASVLIASRNVEVGETAASRLRSSSARAAFVRADVSQVADAERITATALDLYGRLDIMVNCSGVVIRGAALEMTEAEWDMVMDINLKGAWLCSRVAARHMAANGGGRVINVASLNAVRPGKNKLAYGVSKAGLVQLTRALATEWATFKITVNAIAPGMIMSQRLAGHYAEHPAEYQQALERIPLGRAGELADMVGVTIFLASAASAYITGQTIFVDGGSSLT